LVEWSLCGPLSFRIISDDPACQPRYFPHLWHYLDKKWVITTINDLILSLYKIKTLKQLNIHFCNSFRKVLYSWVNYINKKYVIRIVWNETLHTVLCHIHVFVFMNKWHMSFFLYIFYKALFLQKFYQSFLVRFS
jgi:hypothetical protein